MTTKRIRNPCDSDNILNKLQLVRIINEKKAMLLARFSLIALFSLFLIESSNAWADKGIIILNGANNRNCGENDSCFSESGVIISRGQTVTWVNDDFTFHSVKSGSRDTGVNGLFASEVIMPGESFSHSFTQSGLFSYYCPSHPWMNGVVYVK